MAEDVAREILRAVGSIETKLDNLTCRVEDHEARIRTQEQRPAKKWDAATAAVVTGIIGLGLGALFPLITQ